MKTTNTSVAGIIVTYNPDADALSVLVKALSRQVAKIYIVDNGSASLQKNIAWENVEWIELSDNSGIANAQNVGIKRAIFEKYIDIVLFDQDSIPSSSLIEDLVKAREIAHSQGYSVAAVGPVHVDSDTREDCVFAVTKGSRLKRVLPQKERGSFVCVDFVIASGCLISTDVIDDVGMMESELFIDCVDIEWCYRALGKNYKCIAALDANMFHKVGEKPLTILGNNFTTHSPLRHYYYYRNFYHLLRRPYVTCAWKRFTFIKSSLQAVIFSLFLPPRLSHIRAIWKGIYHGLTNRFGKYE